MSTINEKMESALEKFDIALKELEALEEEFKNISSELDKHEKPDNLGL